jgi:outer membrane protein assembly factor BamB
MPMKSHRLPALLVASTLLIPAGVFAQNWPQWRGPLANGVAPDANPPVEWSETKNVKWKVALPGSGTSTPVVWGDRIFLTTAVNTGKPGPARTTAAAPPATFFGQQQQRPPQPGPGFNREEFMKRFDKNGDGQLDESEREALRQQFQGGKGGPPGGRGGRPGGGFGGGQAPTELHDFVVLCLDRATGRTLWQKAVRSAVPHEGHHRDHGFASNSPVTDGEHVYAFFGSRGLFCLDMDGNLKWEKDLGDMRTKNSFGEGSSPVLHGNNLVVNWDHEGDCFIVALDKRTGKELWRKTRDEQTSWATPFVVEHDGKAQVVVNATRKVRSYDLATGDLLWESGGQTDNAIPTPVTGHGRVYVMSGFRGSALHAIKLGQSGDLTDKDAAFAWKHTGGTPYVPSPLLYGDRLYFLKGNDAMISAFNAKDGKPLFTEERLEGIRGVYASLVAAAGRVYVTGRDGGMVVLKDADKLEVLATNKLDEGIDASPALVGHEMLVRGKQHLYCLAAK